MLYYYFLIYFILEEIKDFIVFIDENSSGIIFLVFAIYLLLIYRWPYKLYCNDKILEKYKRENNENDEKYIVQRCYEDGFGCDKDGIIVKSKIEKEKDKNNENKHRDYFYLVEKDKNKKRFYRIVDTYTLNRLGYPRPSRRPEKCFKLTDEYTIGKEIKIYNIVSDINSIMKLKN